MSFGTSVGDIISLVQLAHRNYRNCKEAGGEYLEIAREVRSLHSVLKSIRYEAEKPDSLLFEKDNVSELCNISDGCKGVLDEMQKLLVKYNELADDGTEKSKTKKMWHRMRFGAEIEDLAKFRSKIIVYTSQMAVFLDSIHLKSADRQEKATGRMENKVESGFTQVMERLEGFEEMRKAVLLIATKARASERYTSVISIRSVLSLSTCADDDKETWRQFRSELVALGFRSDSLERHREVLKAYMLQLDRTGVLDEAVVQEGQSHEPWCLNSFFRLTATELPQIDENEEVFSSVNGLQLDKNRTTQSPSSEQGIQTETQFTPKILLSPAVEHSISPVSLQTSIPRSIELPVPRRKRVTRQKSEATSVQVQQVTSKDDTPNPYLVPASPGISNLPDTPVKEEDDEAHPSRSQENIDLNGGQETNPPIEPAPTVRHSTPYQTTVGDKFNPPGSTPSKNRQDTPELPERELKLDTREGIALEARRSTPYLAPGGEQVDPSDVYDSRYLNMTRQRSNSSQASLQTSANPWSDLQQPKAEPRHAYAESYYSDTGPSSHTTSKKATTTTKETLHVRPRQKVRPSSWQGPVSESEFDSDYSDIADSTDDDARTFVASERRKQYRGSTLKPNDVPSRTRSRVPRGHYRAKNSDSNTSFSYSASVNSSVKEKSQGSRRSRSRDRDRSRSPDEEESTSAARFQRLAKAALTAGAVEAFRTRNDPGGWTGEKGKRILTAAIAASAFDPVRNERKAI